MWRSRAASIQDGTEASSPVSIAILQIPWAARRRPYGSRDPLGNWSSRKNPARVSSRSAMPSHAPSRLRGPGSSSERGRYWSAMASHTAGGNPERVAYNPPRIPCSSGNSPTKWVARSHLARSAAAVTRLAEFLERNPNALLLGRPRPKQ